MNDNNLEALDDLRRFLEGTREVDFSLEDKSQRYAFVRRTLIRFEYFNLIKPDKGLVLDYLTHVTGYSRIQIKRLVKRWLTQGRLDAPPSRRRHRFSRTYTDTDIRLLAQLDELHETLSGPTTKKLCERAWQLFGEKQYERLATLSIAHLYNLRRSKTYRQQRRHFDKTRPKPSTIGERRKPHPEGKPGYIRVDTVHQGDLDRIKGLYHINAVDEVTQMEIVCSVEKISERFLIPILKQLIDQFPFLIHGFHADNGSEYINQHVVKLLNKLMIELTKSRPRHSNDNALVESKNGAIVRKHFGYTHIPQRFANLVNEFNQTYLNPYINFHRPCFFPVVEINHKGKPVKKYPYKNMMAPYEKFRSLKRPSQYLKSGVTLKQLDEIAFAIDDNEAAKQLKKAKQTLFKTINERLKRAG